MKTISSVAPHFPYSPALQPRMLPVNTTQNKNSIMYTTQNKNIIVYIAHHSKLNAYQNQHI